MCEVNYLTFASHRGKQAECLFCSEIVECLHNVVGKEGRWRAGMGVGELMIAGYSQRQV
jgi:hypothetical protein